MIDPERDFSSAGVSPAFSNCNGRSPARSRVTCCAAIRGGFLVFGNFSGFESGEPSADGLAKRLNFKPAMNFRETIELQQPCL